MARRAAMTQLGNGLSAADHYADALSVYDSQLSTMLRIGEPVENVLIVQGNLARTYQSLRREEEALQMRRDVYSGRLKLHGEENPHSLLAASNYAGSLFSLKRFEEVRSLLRRTIPVAQRVLGDSNDTTLRTRWFYAKALYGDPGATFDDLREAVTTLEDLERTTRRVFGGEHPATENIQRSLRESRAARRARAFRKDRSTSIFRGCASPSTRRAIRCVSSSVVTASRRSSTVAPSSWQSASA